MYVEWASGDPITLGPLVAQANGDGLELNMMSNRGVKVWPEGMQETFCTDSFRCRFQGADATHPKILALLARVHALGIEVVKTE